MRNTQLINTIQLNQIDTTVGGILVNGVRGERVMHRAKRPYASKRAKHAALPASLSASCGCSSSSLEGSECWQGATARFTGGAQARPAAASVPAPIWARLVVLKALSS